MLAAIPVAPCPAPACAVSAAPDVNTAGLALVENKAVAVGDALHLVPASARQVRYNLPLEQMHAPVLGPMHPGQKEGLVAGLRNHRSGHVELANVSSFAFDEQFNTFQSYGYAANPSGGGMVKHRDAAAVGDQSVYVNAPKRQKTDTDAAAREAKQQQQQQAVFDPSQPFTLLTRQPWAEKEEVQVELTEEQKAYIAQVGAAAACGWGGAAAGRAGGAAAAGAAQFWLAAAWGWRVQQWLK